MPSVDMPLEQLRQYKPPLYREADFESFWESTTAEALKQPINAELIPYDLRTKGLVCYAVRFDGFKGADKQQQGGRIAGWYVRPETGGKFPGVCIYHGYGGRGPRPLDILALASQGICVLSMDCRGQNGQSQDTAVYSEGHQQGWMTQGIRDPKTYYFRYLYADALRALELLAKRDEVDDTRIAGFPFRGLPCGVRPEHGKHARFARGRHQHVPGTHVHRHLTLIVPARC